MNAVDLLLYRKLKSGNQFENLIPKYEGIVKKFDKPSDNSNTFDTLEFMAEWSKKYSKQFSKVAPLLKGSTKAETCKNIYEFLYWHFQYKLDGEAQNLYSPSAAWHYRHKGFDCKSFSLLASILLDNLAIDHAFRQVQQSSPFWSHVYVVVPDGKNYNVIDATTHDNKEVYYSKKYDKKMYHRGLASPYEFNGLGCACNGKPITKSGLGNPMTLSQTVANFHQFLDQLESAGVPKKITNSMLEIVRQNIEKGIDPKFQEVIQKAITLNNSPGQIKTNGLGLDIGATGTAITGAIAGEPASIQYLVSQIIPTNLISSTIGAVFSNGFDLSCWGASYNPTLAKDHVSKDLPFIYEYSNLKNGINNTSVNSFVNLIDGYYRESSSIDRSGYAACTRKGHRLRADAAAQFKTQVIDAIKQTHTLTEINEIDGGILLPKGLDGYYKNKRYAIGKPYNSNPNTHYRTKVYNVVAKDTTSSLNNNPGGIVNQNTQGGFDNVPDKPKSSGLTNVALVGGGIAAAFFLFKPKTDVTKLKPKN